jgi:hypothetical protein
VRINQNELAKKITIIEGKKRSVSIAQVKEIMKITFQQLSLHEDKDILNLINKY